MRQRIQSLLTLLLTAVLTVSAQDLTVKSFGVAQGDLSASVYPRNDRNGKPCGLIKVQLPLEGAYFEGNVMGDTQFIRGEYWVYMSRTSYRLSILHPQFHRLDLNLRELMPAAEDGFRGVEPKVTYNLVINVPQTSPVETDDGMRYLVLEVFPANTRILIDNNQKVPLDAEGKGMVRLPFGRHTYTATAIGYADERGEVVIDKDRTRTSKTIALQSVMSQVTVSCPTPGAQIYVNDQLRGASPWSGQLSAGNYLFEARLNGYRTGKTSLTLAERDNRQITLPALTPITGTLDVSYQPLNAEVWIDGSKAGTSPDIFRKLIVGRHQVELRAEGYKTHSTSVTISEGKTTQLNGQLEKKDEMTPAQMNTMGDNYYYGRNGKEKDYAEAVKWYRKAAEQGDADGQCNLGVMYENGYGVTQDYAEAVKWYRKAAEQGYARAQCSLGVMYQSGNGVTWDNEEALKWYRKAAEQGYARAQCNLGCYYCAAIDEEEAVKWYRKAAEQGDARAQNNLGYMYQKGYGVTQDYAEAVKWYRKAAEQGNATAQWLLGNMYENGLGVTKDDEEAEKWYRKANEKGELAPGFDCEAGIGVLQVDEQADFVYEEEME